MQSGGMRKWRCTACTNKLYSTTQLLGVAHQGHCISLRELHGREGACMAGERGKESAPHVVEPLPAYSHLQGRRLTSWYPAPLLAERCFIPTFMAAMKRLCEMHVHELLE